MSNNVISERSGKNTALSSSINLVLFYGATVDVFHFIGNMWGNSLKSGSTMITVFNSSTINKAVVLFNEGTTTTGIAVRSGSSITTLIQDSVIINS